MTLYNAYITGIDKTFEVDIDFNGSSIPDITEMEMPKVSGFEFEVPIQELPLPFASTDDEWEVTETILSTDTTIYLANTTGISVNDYLWIGIELVKVTNVYTSDIVVVRGQKGTVAGGYEKAIDTSFYLYKNPKTLTGLVVELSNVDTGNILGVGVIQEDAEVSGWVASVECNDLLSTLETEITYKVDNYSANLGEIVYALRDGAEIPFAWGNSITKLKNYIDFGTFTSIAQRMEQITFVSGNAPFSNFKEALTHIQRLTSTILVFDPTTGKYKFVQLAESSSVQTKLSSSILDFMDVEGVAKSSRMPLISSISIASNISLSDSTTTKDVYVLPYASGLGGGQLEYDFTGYVVPKAIVNDIALFFLRQYSIFYSKLEIPSHPILAQELIPGQFIEATDLNEFYTFQDISSTVLYLGMDNGTMIFLVSSTTVKYPISPAFPCYVESPDTDRFVFDRDFGEPEDFLEFNVTGGGELTCTISEYSTASPVIFWETLDHVNFVAMSDGTVYEKTISGVVYVSGGELGGLITDTLPVGQYWVYFPVYTDTDTTTKQKLFAYINRNNY